MTTGYRVLNTLYFAFRTADSVLLLTIVVLTVTNCTEHHTWELVIPTYRQYMVFGAVGVELFGDVVRYTSKFWFLERLGVYVGIGLYALYFLLCYHNLGDKLFSSNSYLAG